MSLKVYTLGSKHWLLHEKPSHLRSSTALLEKMIGVLPRWEWEPQLPGRQTWERPSWLGSEGIYVDCFHLYFTVLDIDARALGTLGKRSAVESCLQSWASFGKTRHCVFPGIFMRSFAVVTVSRNRLTMGFNSCSPLMWEPRLCVLVSLWFLSTWKQNMIHNSISKEVPQIKFIVLRC